MKKIFLLIIFFFTFSFYAQDKKDESIYKVVDSLFREDQFYASISYNLVQNRPRGFKQFGFSSGVTVGFLRDIPFTKNRKWAVAPGVGYSYNNIKQFVSSDDIFENPIVIENIRSTIITHGIDIPFEVRWRNATPTNHKFWRIYTGFKATYVFDATLKFESSVIGTDKQKIKDQINQWQYGIYLATGFNTWNFYAYYGLNSIYKEGNDMSNFNLGFMFYIL